MGKSIVPRQFIMSRYVLDTLPIIHVHRFGDRFEGLHTRKIEPNDICIANILVGQLVRPSMAAAIITNVAPKGWLHLSEQPQYPLGKICIAIPPKTWRGF